jgi:hypothetical protein
MAIKTLHITNSYYPTSGGIRTFYHALLDGANRHRRLVRLVIPGPETRVEEVGEFGRIYYVAAPHVPIVDSRSRWMLPHTYAWGYDSPLRRILAAERPDLVEVCDKFGNDLFSLSFLQECCVCRQALGRRSFGQAAGVRGLIVGPRLLGRQVLAVESSVGGAIDAEGARGKRAIRDERDGWKMRTADPAERAGAPKLSVAADLAGEDNSATIVDDHEFEGRREFACFRGAYQARHL